MQTRVPDLMPRPIYSKLKQLAHAEVLFPRGAPFGQFEKDADLQLMI